MDGSHSRTLAITTGTPSTEPSSSVIRTGGTNWRASDARPCFNNCGSGSIW